MSVARLAGAAAVLLALIAPAAASAASPLDRSFGARGQAVVGDEGDVVAALVVGADGRATVVRSTPGASGGVVLRRLDAHGRLDRTFGSGGEVALRLGARTRAFAAELAADGGLLVGGHTVEGSEVVPFVARVRPEGSLDGGFGTGGVVRFAAEQQRPADQRPAAVSAILTGTRGIHVLLAELSVARLRPDGGLDRSFSGDGIAEAEVREPDRYVREAIDPIGLDLRPDGSVVAVARWVYDAEGSYLRFFAAKSVAYTAEGVARFPAQRGYLETRSLLRTGTRLLALGPAGLAEIEPALTLRQFAPRGLIVDLGIREYGAGVAQRDGSVVLFATGFGRAMVSQRLDARGRPVKAYGLCGRRREPIALAPQAAAEAPDGGVLVAGRQRGGGPLRLARLTARAARTGRFGARQRAVVAVDGSVGSVLDKGLLVHARFTRPVRLRLRVDVGRPGGGWERVAARRVSARTCETASVRFRLPIERLRRRGRHGYRLHALARTPSGRVVMRRSERLFGG